MMYFFRTTATMKHYNRDKWWIDGDIIPNFTTEAENLTEALKKYRERVETAYISISDHAMKNKNTMYCDTENGTKKCGYVITAKTDFQNGYEWTPQYIDLWVNISILSNPEALKRGVILYGT